MNVILRSTHVGLALLSCMALVCTSMSQVQAGDDQIGELLLPQPTYSIQTTLETWSNSTGTTDDVINNPSLPGVIGTFTGLSQRGEGVIEDANDIRLRTFTSSLQISQLNRGAVDPDGPGGVLGPQRSGAVQWAFDLTAIDDYLTNNNLNLTELDFDFVANVSGSAIDKKYDVLLSYTNPAESIVKTDISTVIDIDVTGASANYSNIWLPLHDSNADQVAGDFDSNLTVESADLPLWETGYGTGSGASIGDGDANGDGAVDGSDFFIWQRNLGDMGTVLPEEGDIYGGSFLVLGKDRTGNQVAGDLTFSLLSLYSAGVREFNVILQSGEFLGGNRQIQVQAASGFSITTEPATPAVSAIPEPASLALLALCGLAWSGCRLRRG